MPQTVKAVSFPGLLAAVLLFASKIGKKSFPYGFLVDSSRRKQAFHMRFIIVLSSI
jgi:hypothetical protein